MLLLIQCAVLQRAVIIITTVRFGLFAGVVYSLKIRHGLSWFQSTSTIGLVIAISCDLTIYRIESKNAQIKSQIKLHSFKSNTYISNQRNGANRDLKPDRDWNLPITAPRLRNDLLCVEWDVKHYTLTYPHHCLWPPHKSWWVC